MRYIVIMAGGVGSRFWPASTPQNPKQFISFFEGDKTLLQLTVDRVLPLVPYERIFIVTNSSYVDKVMEQLPSLPKDNILTEPQAKNTAPCIAMAAERIHLEDPNAVMAVLPADHFISQPDAFRGVLGAAYHKAEHSDSLVTIGVQPHRVETGYGYIKYVFDSKTQANDYNVFDVEAFTEKPNYDLAVYFVNQGNYLWNSGMFIWKSSTIKKAFNEYASEISEEVDVFKSIDDFKSGSDALVQFFENCPSISIDFAIMENADDVSVLPGVFGWNDVGSWQAVYELAAKDDRGNAGNSPFFTIDAANNYVSVDSNKDVALVGVDGVAVVETEDYIMVCDLKQSQKVKEAANKAANIKKGS